MSGPPPLSCLKTIDSTELICLGINGSPLDIIGSPPTNLLGDPEVPIPLEMIGSLRYEWLLLDMIGAPGLIPLDRVGSPVQTSLDMIGSTGYDRFPLDMIESPGPIPIDLIGSPGAVAL